MYRSLVEDLLTTRSKTICFSKSLHMHKIMIGLLINVLEFGCALFQDTTEYLLADRGYDTDAIIQHALQAEMTPVIPPKKNRNVLRNYDKDIYKLRHLVENAFLHLKKQRGIATRYAKNVASFVAAVQIRCIALWLKIY